MLIPFKSPPAIRKVSDEIFGQLEAAVKPPVVTHRLNPPRFPSGPGGPSSGGAPTTATKGRGQEKLSYDTVRVLSQEAMGMYQVAVLEAGSAQALEKWMNEHGYVYPKGMEAGMRTTTPALPEGAVFKGAVQAMGFRFRTTEPVVPMRLSAHNPGKLHNRCFILTEQGVRFAQLDKAMVQTQISGPQLVSNLTKALPCKLTYWSSPPTKDGRPVSPWGSSTTLDLGVGEEPDLPAELVKQYQAWAARGRDPHPMNGTAKDLFLSDLLSRSATRRSPTSAWRWASAAPTAIRSWSMRSPTCATRRCAACSKSWPR
jgi:hypothetical protein